MPKVVGAPGFLQIVKQVIDELDSVRLNLTDEDVIVDLTQATRRSSSLDGQLGICGFPLSGHV
jgi:hypothetical protein